MADPLSTGLAAAGAGASLLTGMSANRANKELLRRQRDIANEQLKAFRSAGQYYDPILTKYAQFAGIGMPEGLSLVGDNHYRASGLGGQFGDQETQLRLQQAREEIDRRRRMNANNLRFQLGQRGISSGTIGAALARNQSAADMDEAAFQRQLAIGTQAERERRLANLTGLLGLGFGQGGVAQSVLGQQAGQFGQQAAGSFNNLSNIAQQYMFQRQLQSLGQDYGSSNENQLRLLKLAAMRGELG